MRALVVLCVITLGIGCKGTDSGTGPDGGADGGVDSGYFDRGTEGVAAPLDVPAGQARAGRVTAADLPADASEYLTWSAGDYIVANDKVAMVIEDAGASDLYDPWGGKPVGLARVEAGALVDPADFGEKFIMTANFTVMAEHVSVIADGTDGGAAIVRAVGPLRSMPFIAKLLSVLYGVDLTDVHGALDYVLEPGSEHVDIHFSLRAPTERTWATKQLHSFMFTKRMKVWNSSGLGFDGEAGAGDFMAFVDEAGASYTYSIPGESLGSGISASGFVSHFGSNVSVPAGDSRRLYARITIGGRGLDGALAAHARMRGDARRSISGRVVDSAGEPVEGASVHALGVGLEAPHLNRVKTDALGAFVMTVPADAEVDLVPYRRGDRVPAPTRVAVATAAVGDLTLPPGGFVVVTPPEDTDGALIPARVLVRAAAGNLEGLPAVDPRFGEPMPATGYLHQEYVLPGEELVLRLPTGDWDVIVARGYEYELSQTLVDITEDNCVPSEDVAACPSVSPVLERSVDTTGVMCADLHIHTKRSNDADDAPRKLLAAAAADGVEIPARSEHEYVEAWDEDVEALGLAGEMYGLTSLEMTTMLTYGHFGVLPLDPDPSAPNGGAISWLNHATIENPDQAPEVVPPPELFARVSARPEQPALVINHPMGSDNYFGYVGLNPVTGLVRKPEAWAPTAFHAVEVWNSSSWTEAVDIREAWFRLLDTGLRVFAVGSSDTHGVSRSPVGYPRTCMGLGVDVPPSGAQARRDFADDVRDAVKTGAMTIDGGIYVTTTVNGVGPGGEVTGLGTTGELVVTVQAPAWVDVDAFDIVVDGILLETVQAADFVPGAGAIRHSATHVIDVAAVGSYVVVGAYGDDPLLIHPGRLPFGATNPIFLSR